MRAGNCLGGLGEPWEGWRRSRKDYGGREGGLTGPGGRGGGGVCSPSLVICDSDDSDIPDLEKALGW